MDIKKLWIEMTTKQPINIFFKGELLGYICLPKGKDIRNIMIILGMPEHIKIYRDNVFMKIYKNEVQISEGDEIYPFYQQWLKMKEDVIPC